MDERWTLKGRRQFNIFDSTSSLVVLFDAITGGLSDFFQMSVLVCDSFELVVNSQV